MKVTQIQIARKLGLDVSSVNKILHGVPGLKWRPETVKAVFDAAEKLGYDMEKVKFRHSRSHRRAPVNLQAKVEVELPGPVIIDRGTAKVLDLSLGGARLTELKLERDTLPTEPFTLIVRPKGLALRGGPLRGSVVRLVQNGRIDYGVQFERLNRPTLNELQKFID